MEPRVCLASGSTLATIGAGADYTLKLNSTGRVAVAEITPAEFERWGNTTETTDDFAVMSRRIYNSLPDDFDFLFFVNNEEAARPVASYSGLHISAKSTVSGIGEPLFDNTALYGSAGKLQAMIHVPARDSVQYGPSLHEIFHQWGNALPEVDGGTPGHWGFSSAGGQLGGWEPGTLKDLGGGLYDADGPLGRPNFGTFANYGNSIPYSTLELYLMGLIPADQVTDPIQVARNASYVDFDAGTFRASGIDTDSINDIVAREGARSPSVATSQKTFRALTVVLTPTPLDQASLDRYDDEVEVFSRPGDEGTYNYNFWEATGGRATITMSGATPLASSPATLGLASPTYLVHESDGQVAITVTRAGGDATVTVHYNTSGGSATSFGDYTPVSGVLTFAPGVTSQVITIPIFDDFDPEGDETIGLTLADPTGRASLVGPGSATITILANDGGTTPPVVGPPPTVPPDLMAPTVRSLRKLSNRRGVTAIVLEFGEALDPSKAGSLANYALAMRGRDRKFGTRDDRALKFARVALSADLTVVTLTLKRPLVVTEPLRFLARGSALTDRAGNLLDGNADGLAGGDYIGLVTRKR